MRRVRVYEFQPAGMDVFDRRKGQPEPGTMVVKTQPPGTPRNGTMGHCFVQDAESGDFYGLVLQASLTPTARTVVPRDRAAEARDARGRKMR